MQIAGEVGLRIRRGDTENREERFGSLFAHARICFFFLTSQFRVLSVLRGKFLRGSVAWALQNLSGG